MKPLHPALKVLAVCFSLGVAAAYVVAQSTQPARMGGSKSRAVRIETQPGPSATAPALSEREARFLLGSKSAPIDAGRMTSATRPATRPASQPVSPPQGAFLPGSKSFQVSPPAAPNAAPRATQPAQSATRPATQPAVSPAPVPHDTKWLGGSKTKAVISDRDLR